MTTGKNRRDFIKKGTTGILSVPLLSFRDFEHAKSRPPGNIDYYLKEGLVYLNTGSLGPSPKWVPDRIHELTKVLESNPVAQNWGPLGKNMEEVRDKAAAYLNCSKEEIVLTRNTTEGLSMVSSTLDLKEGDEILTTNHEHGGGEVGLEYRSSVDGIKLRKLELPFPVRSKDQVIDTVLKEISNRTRLLMLSHVSTITGMILPLKEIGREIAGKDIFYLGDGAQACGMIKVDVRDLGVDAYATSGHKWLLGPKETGLLYVREEVQNRINPVFTHSGYQSYSASSGTRNVAQFIVLGEVLDWHLKMEIESTEVKVKELSHYCYQRLSELKGFRVISPEDDILRSAMISAIVVDKSNKEVYEKLKDQDIIVKVLPKYNALRFSTHFFNSTKQIDQLIAALKKF